MAMKGYSAFPKAPALLEPHHQIASCHIQDTRYGGGGLTPLQRCSQCILQPQLTGQSLFESKNWSQEINKPFVPETTESACICICNCLYCVLHPFCIVYNIDPVSVSFDSTFFSDISLVSLLKLYFQTCLLFCNGLFIQTYPGMFSFLSTFIYCHNHFICPRFCISFWVPLGNIDFIID